MSNKSDSKTYLDKNFLLTLKVLNLNNVHYWVCHGTLLGLIRDKNLIEWDHDIDIALWKLDYSKNKIIEIMTSVGFTLVNYGEGFDFLKFSKNGGRNVDFNFYHAPKRKKMAYSEWYLPKNKFVSILMALENFNEYKGRYPFSIKFLSLLRYLFKPIIFLLKYTNNFYLSAGYTCPVKHLKSFKILKIKNAHISVPSNFNEILIYVYGKNWRIPNKNYDWRTESLATKISSERF